MMHSKIMIVMIFLVIHSVYSQTSSKEKRMVAMTSTYQKAYTLGSVYYETGSDKPFTGILYGKYANGNFMTQQEYKDGIGNGKWIDFDPMGNKVCEGTYRNNRVEGPVRFYYEDGSLKSVGQ